MEQEKVKELLARFYEGVTTEAEEQELNDYFTSAGGSDETAVDRLMFLSSAKKIPEPSDEFMARLETITSDKTVGFSSRTALRYFLSAAAGLALLIASYYLFRTPTQGMIHDTYSDPELALAEVKNILTTVSHNMNTGTEALNSFSMMSIAPEAFSEMGRTSRTIDRNLSKLRYLNELTVTDGRNKNNNK